MSVSRESQRGNCFPGVRRLDAAFLSFLLSFFSFFASHLFIFSLLLSHPTHETFSKMRKLPLRSLFLLSFLSFFFLTSACEKPRQSHLTIGSKFFTEQVILAELLAQHIESHTGIQVERKTNLGGTLLVHKALLSGDLDLYVEYTGTALTAVLNESPNSDNATTIYNRVKQQYAQRFNLDLTEPLGFENTFAMVVRSDDASNLHLHTMSDLASVAPKWRAGVGYEFLERPDGFPGWSNRYNLHFAAQPNVMDLGLLYRALVDHQVDIVAGNSTDGLIDSLHLVALEDNLHYFPPYDAVPIVRHSTLEKFPQLRAALADLHNIISAEDMRHLNAQVDADQRDVATVVRAFRASKNL
jgi:osmoprotectant transport system substrate-binding protein